MRQDLSSRSGRGGGELIELSLLRSRHLRGHHFILQFGVRHGIIPAQTSNKMVDSQETHTTRKANEETYIIASAICDKRKTHTENKPQ